MDGSWRATWKTVASEWHTWAHGGIVGTVLIALEALLLLANFVVPRLTKGIGIPTWPGALFGAAIVLWLIVSFAIAAVRVAHRERVARLEDQAKIVGTIVRYAIVDAKDVGGKHLDEMIEDVLKRGMLYVALLQIETSGGRRSKATRWRFSVQRDGAKIEFVPLGREWPFPHTWPRTVAYSRLSDVENVFLEKDAVYSVFVYFAVPMTDDGKEADPGSIEVRFTDNSGNDVLCTA